MTLLSINWCFSPAGVDSRGLCSWTSRLYQLHMQYSHRIERMDDYMGLQNFKAHVRAISGREPICNVGVVRLVQSRIGLLLHRECGATAEKDGEAWSHDLDYPVELDQFVSPGNSERYVHAYTKAGCFHPFSLTIINHGSILVTLF